MDTTFLTIMVTVTVLFVCSLVYGAVKANENFIGVGIIGLFIAGAFGWGFHGTSTMKTTNTLLNRSQYEIAKAPNFVVFSYHGANDLRTDSYPVVLNPEGTKIYLQRNFNHYGVESNKFLTVNP